MYTPEQAREVRLRVTSSTRDIKMKRRVRAAESVVRAFFNFIESEVRAIALDGHAPRAARFERLAREYYRACSALDTAENHMICRGSE